MRFSKGTQYVAYHTTDIGAYPDFASYIADIPSLFESDTTATKSQFRVISAFENADSTLTFNVAVLNPYENTFTGTCVRVCL
jgi:hypothetical protein